LRWPVKVTIFERRGNHYVAKKDRARALYRKDGAIIYELRSTKTTLKPPDFKFLTPQKEIFLISPKRNVFEPFQIDWKKKNPHALGIEDDVRFWTVEQIKAANRKYAKPSILERWWPIIIIFCVAIALSIIFYVVLGQLALINEGLGKVAEQLAKIPRPPPPPAEVVPPY